MKQKNIILLYLFLSFPLCSSTKIPEQIVDEIFSLFYLSELDDFIGEEISQLQHALQCAQLAKEAGADEEIIIAALLHDIGHLCANESHETMNEYGIDQHEHIGAEYVQQYGFSKKVAELIEWHVDPKRYLARDLEYYATISEASQQTLIHQGGIMNNEEARSFEQDPLFEEKVQMRLWDEQAKRIDWHVPDLETYREMIINNLKK